MTVGLALVLSLESKLKGPVYKTPVKDALLCEFKFLMSRRGIAQSQPAREIQLL